MDRASISYIQGEFVYVEYVNGERIRFKLSENSTQKVEKASPTYILTESELDLICRILKGNESFQELEIAPSYFYQKKIERELNENGDIVREMLDQLKSKSEEFTPDTLIELGKKKVRAQKKYENFPGIYIIYNIDEYKYYIGKAERIFERAFKHFTQGGGSSKIYQDYLLGDKFSIHLIPLEKTPFSTLNELERNAISAYDSYHNGYNETPGNILDKPIFKHEDYEKVAELIMNKIKVTKWFPTLTNSKKRKNYTRLFLLEHNLPWDTHFYLTFPKMIMRHQVSSKSSYSKKVFL